MKHRDSSVSFMPVFKNTKIGFNKYGLFLSFTSKLPHFAFYSDLYHYYKYTPNNNVVDIRTGELYTPEDLQKRYASTS